MQKPKRPNPCGPHFEGASLSKLNLPYPDAQEIQKFMDTCKEGKKFFLIISGPPGTGKTYIVAAMFDWVCKNFGSWRYLKDHEVFERLKAGFSQNQDWGIPLSLMTDDELVVWDDLGRSLPNKKEGGDFSTKVYFNFIENRYIRNLPTIITTNYCYEETAEIFNQALASRLFGRKNSCIIHMLSVGAYDLRDHEETAEGLKHRGEVDLETLEGQD